LFTYKVVDNDSSTSGANRISIQQSFSIEVVATNYAPVWEAVTSMEFTSGEEVSITI
jgi:hypothetical protein